MLSLFGAYLVIINLIGFYVMFLDKKKARYGEYRIPEATLWKIAFVGGAIGTTLGLKWFRHKTKHLSFRFGLPAIAIIQFIVITYILI